MARAPGLPGSQFPGDDAQARRIRDLERAVQQLISGRSATVGDESMASTIANEGSLTRAELEEHFLTVEGMKVFDGGTP